MNHNHKPTEVCCCSVGLTMGGIILTEIHNAHDQHYWKAVQPIGSIFGSEVEGEISAIGTTKEQALQHLDEERKRLNESLWA